MKVCSCVLSEFIILLYSIKDQDEKKPSSICLYDNKPLNPNIVLFFHSTPCSMSHACFIITYFYAESIAESFRTQEILWLEPYNLSYCQHIVLRGTISTTEESFPPYFRKQSHFGIFQVLSQSRKYKSYVSNSQYAK